MDHVVETCQRLVALQRRAATPGEAQAAAGALARLLERHRLTLAEVEGSGVGGFVIDAPIYECKRAEVWRRQLIGGLCRHFGVAAWCHVQRSPRIDGRPRVVSTKTYLCGRVGDVECVKSMYGWLDVEAVRLAAEAIPDGSATGKRVRACRRSWLVGFAEGVRLQLARAKAEEQAVPGTSSTAIVKLDGRYDEAMAQIHAKLKDVKDAHKRSTRVETRHFARGEAAGSSIHLGPRLGEEERSPV